MSEEIPIENYYALEQIATGNLLLWNHVSELSETTDPSEQPKIKLAIHALTNTIKKLKNNPQGFIS